MCTGKHVCSWNLNYKHCSVQDQNLWNSISDKLNSRNPVKKTLRNYLPCPLLGSSVSVSSNGV